MPKYKVRIDYTLMGHLRYGHSEDIIEADTPEEALLAAKDGGEIVVDDYSIYDMEAFNHEIEEVE